MLSPPALTETGLTGNKGPRWAATNPDWPPHMDHPSRNPDPNPLLRQLGLPLRGVWALTSSELPRAVPDGPT